MAYLRRDLFRTILSQEADDFRYSIVHPLGQAMILLSEADGSALAALHLRCQDNEYQNDSKGNRGKALFTKRPKKSEFKCDFQGIISKDNQEFELVPTNHSRDGLININIMKRDVKVTQVDPGSPDGLNKVNEIKPFHSYAIQSDQACDGVLVLGSIKKTDSDKSKEHKITVREAETGSSTPVGTYYYPSVVPQADKPGLVQKFKKTMWGCTDLFYVKEKIMKYESFASLINSSIDVLYMSDTRFEVSSRGSSDSLEVHTGRSSATAGSASDGSDEDQEVQADKSIKKNGRVRERKHKSIGLLSANREIIVDDESGDDVAKDDGVMQLVKTFTAGEAAQFKTSPTPALACFTKRAAMSVASVSEDLIRDSYAASVSTGRKIKVQSSSTGIDYQFPIN